MKSAANCAFGFEREATWVVNGGTRHADTGWG